MNNFFAGLLALSFLGMIILEIIFLYNKVTHHLLFHEPNKRNKTFLLCALLIFCVSIFGFQSTNPAPSTAKPPVKKIYKTKTVGKKDLASARIQAYQLEKDSSKVDKQSESVEKLVDKVSSQKVVSSEAISSEKAAASESIASQKADSVSESQQAKKASQQAQASSSTKANRTSTQGDLDTGNTKKIVGNVNSKIYHTPDQAGYHMSSKNAIYFNTEAEAQAAGYRKAKR